MIWLRETRSGNYESSKLAILCLAQRNSHIRIFLGSWPMDRIGLGNFSRDKRPKLARRSGKKRPRMTRPS